MGPDAPVPAEAAVTDRIVLTMPSDSGLRGIATLVLGGIGSRHDLPYERMDDLQLALVSALDAAPKGQVSIEVDAGPEGLRVALGPLRDGSRDDEGLALVLSRLVDSVENERRDGTDWVSLVLEAQPAPTEAE
jgi:hypothetical protein